MENFEHSNSQFIIFSDKFLLTTGCVNIKINYKLHTVSTQNSIMNWIWISHTNIVLSYPHRIKSESDENWFTNRKILSPYHKNKYSLTFKKYRIFYSDLKCSCTNGNWNQNKSIISHVRSLYSRNFTLSGESYHSQINHLYGGIVRSHKKFLVMYINCLFICLYSRWILKFMFGLMLVGLKKKKKIKYTINISHHYYNVIK